MGSVLAFAPRDAAAIRKPPAAGDTGSVVIFPGIRYERHDADAAAHNAAVNHAETQRDKPRPSH